jgi:hypothetical protein
MLSRDWHFNATSRFATSVDRSSRDAATCHADPFTSGRKRTAASPDLALALRDGRFNRRLLGCFRATKTQAIKGTDSGEQAVLRAIVMVAASSADERRWRSMMASATRPMSSF